MLTSNLQHRLSLFGWLMYDFANTIFSMNILTMYFAQWVIVDLGYPDIYYSAAYSLSMIAVAVTLPVLGHRSDERQNKKSFLVAFSLGCIGSTLVLGVAVFLTDNLAALALVGLVCLVFANYFFEGGLVFYNALLSSVSHKSNVGTISGIGTGVGYVGAILGLLMVQPLVDNGFLFLPEGRQSAFLPTAILFMLFFVPTWVFLKEKQAPIVNAPLPSIGGTIRKTWESIKKARKRKGAFRFLVANYFFVDAISTLIIFMAVYAEKVMGLPDSEKVTIFIASTVSAVFGSVAIGRVSDSLGYYKTLKWVVIGWVVLLIAASVTTAGDMFWIVGSCAGILLGSMWSVARPLLNSLVPADELGLFYGLYSLTGKAAAVVGPLIWGGVVMWFTAESAATQAVISILQYAGLTVSGSVQQTIEYRFALISLAIMMVVGFIVYRKVPDRFRKDAAES